MTLYDWNIPHFRVFPIRLYWILSPELREEGLYQIKQAKHFWMQYRFCYHFINFVINIVKSRQN